MYATVAAFDQLTPRLFACYRGPLLPQANGMVAANELLVAWHLYAGSVDIRHATGQLTARAASTVLLPAGLARQQAFAADTVLLSVRFSLLWPDASLLQISGLPLVLDGDPGLITAGEALAAEAGPLPAPLYGPFERTRLSLGQHVAVKSRLLAFVASFLAVVEAHGGTVALRRKRDPRLTRCLAILHRIDTCSTVPYADLQAASGLGRAQIDRLLRAELGRTPKGIIDGQCHRRACDLLLEPARSVAQVASILGFSDVAHFRRWFALHQHQSPSAFRATQMR